MVKLFSIRQIYSDRIFRKEKLVEFRRQNVNINRNETCLVYTSSPIKRITGYFVVKEKIRLPIRMLWDKTKEIAGITREEFLKYFDGCNEGTALVFEFVEEFVKSLSIDEIKSSIRSFRPPQSYYNLDTKFRTVLAELFQDKGIMNLNI